jgi:hypothetical protein
MKTFRSAVMGFLVTWAFVCGSGDRSVANTPAGASSDGRALSLAICPIVYPLDQAPSERGFHYTFYGNGFFINKEGYLLTMAAATKQHSSGIGAAVPIHYAIALLQEQGVAWHAARDP